MGTRGNPCRRHKMMMMMIDMGLLSTSSVQPSTLLILCRSTILSSLFFPTEIGSECISESDRQPKKWNQDEQSE